MGQNFNFAKQNISTFMGCVVYKSLTDCRQGGEMQIRMEALNKTAEGFN